MTADHAAMIRRFFAQLSYEIDAAMMADFGISVKDDTSEDSSDLPLASLEVDWNGKYLAKARHWLPLARHLPGVRGIFVCNSVAFGTADRDSDIDLLIVTASDRLWVARVFCTLFFHFLGLRRHGDRIVGRFCLSFFVTEDALDFKQLALQPRDPYLAYWLAALVPIFGDSIAMRLAKANQDFVFQHVGARIRYHYLNQMVASGSSTLRNLLEKFFGKRWNRFLKSMLLPRTERKKALLTDTRGTIVSDTILKFHNRDRRHEFLA